MQHPLMAVHEGGHEISAEEWDARTSADIAALIAQYLRRHPAPRGSLTAQTWLVYCEQLSADSDVRLAALGARRLRPA